MTSHEYARLLKAAAEFFESKPDVELDHTRDLNIWWRFSDRDKFLAAAKAMGSGVKKVETGPAPDFIFTPHTPQGVRFTLDIPRDRVCVKVQDEKWECQSLFSQEEMAQIGGAL